MQEVWLFFHKKDKTTKQTSKEKTLNNVGAEKQCWFYEPNADIYLQHN